MSNIMPIIIFSLMARRDVPMRKLSECTIITRRLRTVQNDYPHDNCTHFCGNKSTYAMRGGSRELDAPIAFYCGCKHCKAKVSAHKAGTIDKTQRAKSKRVPPKRDKTLYNDILIDPTVLEHYKWHKSGKLAQRCSICGNRSSLVSPTPYCANCCKGLDIEDVFPNCRIYC